MCRGRDEDDEFFQDFDLLGPEFPGQALSVEIAELERKGQGGSKESTALTWVDFIFGFEVFHGGCIDWQQFKGGVKSPAKGTIARCVWDEASCRESGWFAGSRQSGQI